MSTTVIPEPIAQLQRQLDQFRSTQPRGRKLPDSVWQAAVELHGEYSGEKFGTCGMKRAKTASKTIR
jgi:hypothetical protein